jgi:FtsP/CotA-like multicopper oxidase with cupredoxin domain
VAVDEFRIGVAETYDVIVEPAADRAYTVFAQSIDRSGYARGTLTPDPSWLAEIPPLDPSPVLTHRDMGMAHGDGHDHGSHAAVPPRPATAHVASDHRDHAQHDSGHENHQGHQERNDHQAYTGDQGHESHQQHIGHQDHRGHQNHKAEPSDPHAGHDGHGEHQSHMTHTAKPAGIPLAPAGFGVNFGEPVAVRHAASEYGPQVDMRAEMPVSGIGDPGVGLRDHQTMFDRRVLTYADLRGLHPTRDKRQPGREIELHLTGNMHRYMWSVDGVRHADAEPIILHYGERVRFILVNDTMMTHPFHLHGLWSELETGDPEFIPRKHTVLVQPGSKVSYLVTADAKGRWAYHCHLLYHMGGMMREVRVI